MKKQRKASNVVITVFLSLLSLVYLYPIFMILMNSLKTERAITTSAAFQLPTAETFAGLENYVSAIISQGFLQSLGYSLFITISSVALILVCCSMCAWYITRVKGRLSRGLYFLFVLSMVVPFQMVMFTLSQTADRFRISFFGLFDLRLNTPWTICIIYLGFGAGLAVFMFCGFVRSVPVEVEEASMIDGCNPLQTFFLIVMPMLKPTLVSVGILEAMWVWNDYLLPTLVLDIKKYMTIPMLIQHFRGSFGRVEMGPMMACIMLTIIPIIIVYLAGQKYIIKGVAAGAVKG
ncbi:carbohydrate ABC transporter permease [Pseudoflavonifractor phocaeensis]|uniref:carbohydrate ABC transporter permease n=1 Tax=Pseudoflavonifractor phocaeensis TaxID=1870988 RepID=UPI00313CCEBF